MTSERNYLRLFVIFLVLTFPILCNMTRHAGSIVLVLLTLCGLPLCFSKSKRPEIPDEVKWVIWAFVSYFAVYLLSFGLNYILGNLEKPRMKHIDHEQRMLYLIPVFLLLRRIKLPQWALWYGTASSAIFFGAFALAERFIFLPGVRVYGSYHSIAFGDIALVTAFIGFAGLPYFRRKHTAGILIPVLALLSGLSAAFLSGSRGAWIAIPALMVMVLLHMRHHFRLRTIAATIVSICLLFTAAYHIPQTGISARIHIAASEVNGYFRDNTEYSSPGARIEGWKAGWIIFTEHLLLGGGPGNFQPIVLKKITEGEVSDIIKIHSQPHSAFFSTMADCGVPGLTALLSLFLVPIWMIISLMKKGLTSQSVCYAALMLIIGFMHFGLTETIFGRNVFVSYYIVMTAVVFAVEPDADDPDIYRGLPDTSSQ